MNISFRIFLLSIAAALTVISCTPSYSGKKQPLARDGVLDLQEWDFDIDGPVELSGEWLFYWDEILTPEKCNTKDCIPATGIGTLPGRWRLHPVTGETLPSRGAATYRLTVLMNEHFSEHILALGIPDVRSAGTLYVNGSLINRDGVTGKSEKTEQLGMTPSTKSFYIASSQLSLLMAISNFHYPTGGMSNPLTLGTKPQMTEIEKRTIVRDWFVFGSLMIIFLYHLSLFLLRRAERSYLYFGLYCLFVGIFGIVSGNTSIHVLIPSIPPGLIFFLFHLSFYFTLPVFGRFLYWNFPGVIPLTFVRIIDPLPFIFLLTESMLPCWVCSYTLNVYQICISIAIMVTGYYLLKAFIKGYQGMGVFLLGFIILVVTFFNDALYYNKTIHTGYFISYGLFLFILFQSFLLSYRFARAFQSVEKLTEELAEMNEDLAEKVKERTEELNAALTEMESINESLISTNRSLEEAGEIAERDMKMAVNVQKAIIFKEPPPDNEWDIACSFRPMAGVSGDFYDFYELDDRLVGIGLFDVSGHGISSGLVTMIAKTILFRLFRDLYDSDFSTIFNRFNRDLYREIGQAFYYLTGLLLRLDKNTVHCLNAAHSDVLVRDSKGVKPAKEKDPQGRSGFLLGIRPEDFPYVPHTFTVQSGDILALFTDGITEARNSEDMEFGAARMVQALAEARGDSSKEILDCIIKYFYSYIGDAEIKDDFTLIILRKR